MKCILLLSIIFPAAAPIEVRVAVVAYEDFHGELGRWERLFAELPRQRDPPLRFRLAPTATCCTGSVADRSTWP